MRRLALALIVLALHATPLAQSQSPAPRPSPADPIVRLIADLETALSSGRPADLLAHTGASIPADDLARFARSVGAGNVTAAAIRERARRPTDEGFEILAEVFVAHGRSGRIATWQLSTRPRAGAPDRAELIGLVELASVDGLLKLALEPKQFAVHKLVFEAPDFIIRLDEGSAFVAESGNGVTGIVLRGRGQVQFTPSSEAEKGQVRLFSGHPAFTSAFDAVYIRLNPGEFASRVKAESLVPATLDPREMARAQEVFAARSPRTYNLDLRDLSPDRWSLEPTYGSVVVEFRANRYGWLTYARSPGDSEDISFFDRARNRNVSVYTSSARLAERGRYYSEEDGATFDVLHYNLDLRFDPERSWISGSGSLRLRLSQTSTTLMLKLAEPLAISAVSSPGFGPLLTLRIVGQNKFIVSLPRTVERGTVLDLEVRYSGRLDPQGLEREAIAPEAESGQNQSPTGQDVILTPEPRFLYSNRVYWYPQAQSSDYATATMRLTVPSEYQLVGSGSLTGSTLSRIPDAAGSRASDARYGRMVEYAADRPVRYLSVVISRFVPLGRSRVEVPALSPGSGADSVQPAVNLEVVSTPRLTGRNRQLSARVSEILRFFATRIGEAPYPDFTLAALDDNLPGGHSPAFFAVLHQPLPTTPFSWSSDPVAFEGFPSFFLAHEVAHQWWGQAVGWKNYHEQWLSEGLSQYFAVLFAAADRGPDTGRNLLRQMRDSAMDLTSQGPIYLGYRLGHIQGDSRVFRGIVYNKSAVVLHMLRQLMGDEAFFRGIQRFYSGWRFRKAGSGDFLGVMQQETPVRLERFFERWIMGASVPRLRINASVAAGGRTATVRVEQIGDVFDLPYEITIHYAEGDPERVVLKLTEAVSEHQLTLRGPVRRIDTRDDLVLANIER
jgi:hypothetical protein